MFWCDSPAIFSLHTNILLKTLFPAINFKFTPNGAWACFIKHSCSVFSVLRKQNSLIILEIRQIRFTNSQSQKHIRAYTRKLALSWNGTRCKKIYRRFTKSSVRSISVFRVAPRRFKSKCLSSYNVCITILTVTDTRNTYFSLDWTYLVFFHQLCSFVATNI